MCVTSSSNNTSSIDSNTSVHTDQSEHEKCESCDTRSSLTCESCSYTTRSILENRTRARSHGFFDDGGGSSSGEEHIPGEKIINSR